MKIEKLIFRNLNSIQGKWEIDFSDPTFERTGLFAITGPTGSGKSTILDAIALALYGATPRLGVISEARNELMTKGEGTCSSEIVFRARGERYRASWSQNRARQSSTGNLQTPMTKLEIFDRRTGDYEGISEGKKQYVSAVAKATGLTFPQFCRSVLLAQGQFAAFLQANKDERAQSLEQITGTAIYGNISKQVHIDKTEATKKLTELKEGLRLVEPLEPEVRKEKEELKKKLDQEETELGKRVTQLGLALGWMERYQELLKNKDKLQQEWQALEGQAAVCESKKAEAHKAQVAKEIHHLYINLENLRKDIQRTTEEIGELQRKLDEKSQEKEKLKAKETELNNRKSKHELEEAALKELIQQVRPLDSKIEATTTEKNKIGETLSKEEAKLSSCQRALKEAQETVKKTQEAITREQDWLEKHKQVAVLKNDRDSIISSSGSWKAEAAALKSAKQKTANAQKDFTNKKSLCQNTEAKTTLAEKDFSATKEERQRLENELTQALQSSPREKFSEEKLEIAQQLHDLNDALRLADTQKENLEAVTKTNQRMVELKNEAAQQAIIAAKSKELVESKQGLIKKADLELQVASLEKWRKELRSGEPCPLCGALDHPLCEHKLESEDSVRKRKELLRKDIEAEEKEISKAEKAIAAANAQLALETDALPLLQEKCKRGQQQCEKAGESLAVQWNGDPVSFKEELLRKQGEIQNKQKNVEAIIKKAVSLEKGIDKVDQVYKKQEKAYQDLQLQLTGLKESVKTLDESLLKAQQDEKSQESAMEEKLTTIRNQWGSFLEEPLDAQAVPAFLDLLLKKEEEYSAHQSTFQKLSDKLSNDKNLSQMQESAAKSQEQETTRAKAAFVEVENRLNAIVIQRKELFQDKDCTVEENKSEAEGKQIEKEIGELRNLLNDTNTQITSLTSRQLSAKENVGNLVLKEKQDDLAWKGTLAEKGFGSEDQWKESLLPDEAIQSLNQWIQEYESKKTLTSSQIVANSGLIDAELKKRDEDEKLKELATHTEDELKNLQRTTSEAQKQKKEDFLKVSVDLERDNNVREQYAELSQKINAQVQVCRDWELLHQLIGSSDGKTYREYAQGLTFKTLVRKANSSLSKLSSRFLLCIRANTNLELDIKDQDLLDRVRPIDNLSGGETFLISLALALGLSDMAGQNVRIDSLFLDEGFGTLDDENLQRVIGVLEKLHSQGKLIGIISHVDKIKETIFPQITVVKQTRGKSILEGSGVTRLEEKSKKRRRI